MRVGVLALQGGVEEHLAAFEKLGELAVRVKTAAEAEKADALVIPGGESTTLSKLLFESGVAEIIKEKAKTGMPVWGTCAGMILLAKKGDWQVRQAKQKLLGLMDVEVDRNAFGRQRESFEAKITVGKIRGFQAVFIRAPAITRVYGKARVLAEFGGKIIAAEQGNLLATSFHPELAGDLRLHEYFLGKTNLR